MLVGQCSFLPLHFCFVSLSLVTLLSGFGFVTPLLYGFSLALCVFLCFLFVLLFSLVFFFLWLDRANQHRSSLLFSFFPLSIFFFCFLGSFLFCLSSILFVFFSPSLVLAFRLAFIGPYSSSLRMVIL